MSDILYNTNKSSQLNESNINTSPYIIITKRKSSFGEDNTSLCRKLSYNSTQTSSPGNSPKRKKKLQLFKNFEENESYVTRFKQSILGWVMSAMNLIILLIFSFLSLFSILIKALVYVILSIIEIIEKKFPKVKNPIKRTISNENFNRLKRFAKMIDKIGEKDINIVLEINQFLTIIHDDPQDGFHQITIDDKLKFVEIRDGSQRFIEDLTMLFNVVVFTTYNKQTVDQIMPFIDKKQNIDQIFSQQSCIKNSKGFIKDLSVVTSDFNKTIAIDINSHSCCLNEDNCLIFSPWTGGSYYITLDDHLKSLKDIQSLSMSQELRDVIFSYKNFSDLDQNFEFN